MQTTFTPLTKKEERAARKVKDDKWEKFEDVVVTLPTLTSEIAHTLAPTKIDPKAKARDDNKKASQNQPLVPQAIANQRTHAAIAVVQITPHAPATRDRTTKRMRKTRHHINRQISTYRSMKQP